MSSSKTAAVLLCLALCGCGFTPMYGDHGLAAGVTAAHDSNVEILAIPDRDGQYLRNQLIDRLYLKGRPADAPFILAVQPLKSTQTNLGIRRDATSTRAMQEIDTTITIKERKTGQIVLQREERAVGGYDQLDNQFATLVSEQSVNDHMLEELADSIVMDVNLYFTRRAAEGPDVKSVATPAATLQTGPGITSVIPSATRPNMLP